MAAQSAEFVISRDAIRVARIGREVVVQTIPAHLFHVPHLREGVGTEVRHRRRTVREAKALFDEIVADYRAKVQQT